MIRVIALALALSATAASALPLLPAYVAPPRATFKPSAGLTCADFRRNSDGSWSPTHTLLVGTMALSPGSRLQSGMKVFGSDLATTLTNKCLTQ